MERTRSRRAILVIIVVAGISMMLIPPVLGDIDLGVSYLFNEGRYQGYAIQNIGFENWNPGLTSPTSWSIEAGAATRSSAARTGAYCAYAYQSGGLVRLAQGLSTNTINQVKYRTVMFSFYLKSTRVNSARAIIRYHSTRPYGDFDVFGTWTGRSTDPNDPWVCVSCEASIGGTVTAIWVKIEIDDLDLGDGREVGAYVDDAALYLVDRVTASREGCTASLLVMVSQVRYKSDDANTHRKECYFSATSSAAGALGGLQLWVLSNEIRAEMYPNHWQFPWGWYVDQDGTVTVGTVGESNDRNTPVNPAIQGEINELAIKGIGFGLGIVVGVGTSVLTGPSGAVIGALAGAGTSLLYDYFAEYLYSSGFDIFASSGWNLDTWTRYSYGNWNTMKASGTNQFTWEYAESHAEYGLRLSSKATFANPGTGGGVYTFDLILARWLTV